VVKGHLKVRIGKIVSHEFIIMKIFSIQVGVHRI